MSNQIKNTNTCYVGLKGLSAVAPTDVPERLLNLMCTTLRQVTTVRRNLQNAIE
jgi:hypothetical protein